MRMRRALIKVQCNSLPDLRSSICIQKAIQAPPIVMNIMSNPMSYPKLTWIISATYLCCPNMEDLLP